jgi:fission 1 protein
MSSAALLMEKEPTNMQAISLGQLIDKGVARGMHFLTALLYLTDASTEGYIGMALVGGVAAVGALLVAGAIRRATRK